MLTVGQVRGVVWWKHAGLPWCVSEAAVNPEGRVRFPSPTIVNTDTLFRCQPHVEWLGKTCAVVAVRDGVSAHSFWKVPVDGSQRGFSPRIQPGSFRQGASPLLWRNSYVG